MEYTIDFGKVDYNNRGRKTNRITIDVRLEDGRLSICGNIWNSRETDCLSCGQNLEDIATQLRGNKQFNRILAIWRKYQPQRYASRIARSDGIYQDYPGFSRVQNCFYLSQIPL